MSSTQDQSRTIDGVTYLVKQDMVRVARPKSLIQKWSVAILGIVFGLPMFAVFAPAWYLIMMNKNFSQRLSSKFIPAVMPMLDKAFKDVKKELLKDLHGRVLDVGCGAGDWLKYFAKAAHVTELEPNTFLHSQIERNVRKFTKDNPNVEVEIVHKFVGELDTSKPYDYVVFGNVMCEVPDQRAFLRDIDKVLKPGGKIVFQEHIRRPRGTLAGVFQDVFNVWWCKASDGCNCNRETVEEMKKMPGWKVDFWDLKQDGFVILDRMAVGIITKEAALPTPVINAKM